MKYLKLILLCVFIYSCSDPTSIDADREKHIIDDPSQHPAKFLINPTTIDLGMILLGSQSNDLIFNIKNITESNLTINSIKLKNYPILASIQFDSPFTLSPFGSNQDNKQLAISISPDKYGYFIDTLLVDNYKNPITIVKANIPALIADDIYFEDTKISEFQLNSFKFRNISDKVAIITEFELIDNNNVFLNEPAVKLPIIINPKSESGNIKITFNPNNIEDYSAYIQIKANFDGADYPYMSTIKISGKGVN